MNKQNETIKRTEITTSDKATAMKVSIVSIAVNIFLSVFKLIAGVIAGSRAMISDAVHSASDVFSTFVVMIGVSLSSKQSDKDHPYGHERMECVASILLSVVLAITGLGIGMTGINKITGRDDSELIIPGILALVAAVVSIVV